MNRNFIHFLSTVPGTIHINGTLLGTIDNTTTIEQDIITNCEKVYVTFEPFSDKNNYIPYTYVLKTDTRVECENEYINIVPFPENNWDIIMHPYTYTEFNDAKVLLSQNVGNYYISIVNDNATKVYIYSGQNVVFSKTLPLFSNAKIDHNKSLIIIEGVIDENTYYLLVIDTTNFAILYDDYSESIEINETHIETLKNIHNIPHHARITKIDTSTLGVDTYYVYSDGEARLAPNKYYIPKAMLECLLAKDEKELHRYMSNKYSNITVENLNNFFGKVDGIYLNRHNHKDGTINYTLLSNGKYRNYDFLISNGAIVDIIENNEI